MASFPMEQAAAEALCTCANYRAAGNFEAAALVEIDCLDAFNKLLRDGSPRLRRALLDATLNNPGAAKAA